jgi:hypothetical protein
MYYIIFSFITLKGHYIAKLSTIFVEHQSQKAQVILCNYPFKRNIEPNVSCYDDPDASSIFKNVRLQADQNFIIWLQV